MLAAPVSSSCLVKVVIDKKKFCCISGCLKGVTNLYLCSDPQLNTVTWNFFPSVAKYYPDLTFFALFALYLEAELLCVFCLFVYLLFFFLIIFLKIYLRVFFRMFWNYSCGIYFIILNVILFVLDCTKAEPRIKLGCSAYVLGEDHEIGACCSALHAIQHLMYLFPLSDQHFILLITVFCLVGLRQKRLW